jgi:hypothetical protein
MKQTAVQWLYSFMLTPLSQWPDDMWAQAEAMERQQMDKVASDWWNEGASYMHNGGRKYESFEQYYNETFKSNE